MAKGEQTGLLAEETEARLARGSDLELASAAWHDDPTAGTGGRFPPPCPPQLGSWQAGQEGGTSGCSPGC